MKIAICIDYDNLSKLQKSAGITSVIFNALIKLPEITNSDFGTCEVRLYGGWFEGESLSNLSQDISASIQSEFPTLIKIPKNIGTCKLNVTVELAYSLLEEPSHHLFNTYRRKGKPSNLRVEKQINIGCAVPTCPLPIARKLLEKGVCPSVGCTNKSKNIVYRHEQKLVDTMLTCDLIYLATHLYDYLIIISADDDFLPPIRTLLLRGVKVVRVHPRMSTDHTPITVGGKKLIEVGL
ncbi:NYN domain-containing protein [Pseudomonas sp. WS 5111]|uniref:NYN domain-containing protein n=1 Tax=Pseudomonas sp. WS 5111 TaxID=2717493 RepID=UPI001474CC1B|nr:NYN domain-containing protein [Pseudomonas sp. WS 5111]NMX68136.1 NYN domain-containing protein [Pseudomonas sp. WS 5111]NMX68306.1 NYN domain-containing protein [Pseudomonas sp. WS 5111]